MELAEIITLIIAFCFGAILGSFACCQAWRIRLKQLRQQEHSKDRGRKQQPASTRQLNPGKWSICLSCGHRLKATENIPVFSWLIQRGKCKHCGAKIGKAELFSEVTLGLAFVALAALFYPTFAAIFRGAQLPNLSSQLPNVGSRLLSANSLVPNLNLPMLITIVLVLIVSVTVMWVMLIYDAKWQELPTKLLTILNACAIIYTILRFVGLVSGSTISSDIVNSLLSTLAAVAILAGVYFCLYFFSGERLVGSGDWLLALPIALFLGNWWLALLVLFLSNLLGSIVGIILKIKTGTRQIPFGPFLIIAFVIVYAAQPWLTSLLPSLG